jgi:hypothetical protein
MAEPTEVETPQPSIVEEARQAFALGKKITVTPRGADPIEILIRPFYVDQALETIDSIQKIYNLLATKADASGNVDMFEVFKEAKDEVLEVIMKITEQNRAFIGRLELDDLLNVFVEIFNQNKDFFDKRVKGTLGPMLGQISSML